jgi:hypothetical protein
MTREEWEYKQNALKQNVTYVPTGVPGEVKSVVEKTVPSKLSPSGFTPAGRPIHPTSEDRKANITRV